MDLPAASVGDACVSTNAPFSTMTDEVVLSAREAGLLHVKAVTSNLTGYTVTSFADKTITLLGNCIAVLNGNRTRPTRKYLAALTAIVADLLTAANHDPYRPCLRPTAAGTFTGGPVGYHPFAKVLADLAREGFVTVYPGAGPCGGEPGVATRIFPTAALIEWLGSCGITPHNRLTHFAHHRAAAAASAVPIRLVASSTRGRKYVKVQGKPIMIDMNDSVVAALAQPIIEINSFLADQTFSMAEGVTLFRSYNGGDDPDHDWRIGGRLNCHGGGYQMMSKDERKTILINGLPTVEIDVSACHLTIAYGLLQERLPSYDDLYATNGIPRWVVKTFVNYLLGKGAEPTQWHPDHRKGYQEGFKSDLSKDYPIKRVGPLILAAHPILQKAITAGTSWGCLQNADSDIIVNTVHTLATRHGVCTLPIHDSLIVPISLKEIALNVFSSSFRERVGVTPYIK